MKTAALQDSVSGEPHPEAAEQAVPPTAPESRAASHAATRLAIRTARVVLGFVLAIIAFWLLARGVATLDEPFASLSPLRLIGGLFAACGGLALAAIALVSAFGAGPTRIEQDPANDDGLNGLP